MALARNSRRCFRHGSTYTGRCSLCVREEIEERFALTPERGAHNEPRTERPEPVPAPEKHPSTDDSPWWKACACCAVASAWCSVVRNMPAASWTPAAEDAIPVLQELAKDGDGRVREVAQQALRAIMGGPT